MTLRADALFAAFPALTNLPCLTPATAKCFLQADDAVLILVRGDCSHCAAYLAQAGELLGAMSSGPSVAALVLDRPAGLRFRCDNPSIGGLGVFPYLVRFRRGRRIAGFAASCNPGLLTLLASRSMPNDETPVPNDVLGRRQLVVQGY